MNPSDCRICLGDFIGSGFVLGPCDHAVCSRQCALDVVKTALSEFAIKSLRQDDAPRTSREQPNSRPSTIVGVQCPICSDNNSVCGIYPSGWIDERCIESLASVPADAGEGLSAEAASAGASSSAASSVPGQAGDNQVAMLSANEVHRYRAAMLESALAATPVVALAATGAGAGAGSSSSSSSSSTPALSFLRCPGQNRGQIHTVDHDATSSGRPTLRSCYYCATEMCVCCGLPWVDADSGTRHFGLTCQQWQIRRSESAEATRLLQDVPGRKQCPKCASVIERWRGHACHHVTCRCGYSMCYVCLERWPAGGSCVNRCSYQCSDACDCAPCPDCKPGRRCKMCHGACVSCTSETAEQRAAREVRQAKACESMMREQHWCGPRQRRPADPNAATVATAPLAVDSTSVRQWWRDIVGTPPSPDAIDPCAAAEWLRSVSDHLERVDGLRTDDAEDQAWPGGDEEEDIVQFLLWPLLGASSTSKGSEPGAVVPAPTSSVSAS